MRLIDKLTAHGPRDVRDKFRMSAPVSFVVDEIAVHYHQTSKQMEWSADDYPYAMPPWNTCVVEWSEPAWRNTPNGVLVSDESVKSGVIVQTLDSDTLLRFDNGETLRDMLKRRRADVALLLAMCHDHGGTAKVPGSYTIALMTSDGYCLGRSIWGPYYTKWVKSVGETEAKNVHDDFMVIAFLAFTFANCSNVKLEDVSEELAPTPKVQRRLKLPAFKRYTLNIAGHSTKPRREFDGDPQTGIMPFHLCRGHFATYTAEKPLFGNPKNVGKFWIPPHTRGREERGRIEKNYAVKG